MIYTSAQRYLTPKWQARVAGDQGFVFENGVTVYNLWELKQALRILREDIIAYHVHDQANHIADWVEYAINDVELADELRKTISRWGLVVALERQLMRTLNLPHYVASRWLRSVDLPFQFVNDKKANSVGDLKHILESCGDQVVEFHSEREPNDIAVWVNDVVGDYQLAEVLAESSTRQAMLEVLSDHLQMLTDAVSCK